MSALPVSVVRLTFEGPHAAQRGAIAALLERKRLESPVTVQVVEVSGVFSVVIRGGDSECVELVAEAARHAANTACCVGVAA